MNNCSNLYFLSTIACQLSECLSKNELELLAVYLQTLGEMLDAISVENAVCGKSEQ